MIIFDCIEIREHFSAIFSALTPKLFHVWQVVGRFNEAFVDFPAIRRGATFLDDGVLGGDEALLDHNMDVAREATDHIFRLHDDATFKKRGDMVLQVTLLLLVDLTDFLLLWLTSGYSINNDRRHFYSSAKLVWAVDVEEYMTEAVKKRRCS